MPTLDKRDRAALLKKAGIAMSDHYLRQCLAGTQSMSIDNARKIVHAWREIRAVIQQIYGDLPEIRLNDLIYCDRKGLQNESTVA